MTTDPGYLVDCNEVVELVTEFLEGTLDEPMRTRVAAHLALCKGCETYVEQMRQTIRTLGRVEPAALPDDARSALLAAFRARPD